MPEKVRTSVILSAHDKLIACDWEKWGMNLLKFVAPTLGIFFAQLSVGVPMAIAAPVALLALYQALADLFSKYKSETKY